MQLIGKVQNPRQMPLRVVAPSPHNFNWLHHLLLLPSSPPPPPPTPPIVKCHAFASPNISSNLMYFCILKFSVFLNVKYFFRHYELNFMIIVNLASVAMKFDYSYESHRPM